MPVRKIGKCIDCGHNTGSYIGVWVNGLVLCKHCAARPIPKKVKDKSWPRF